jgi:hypothetical protein
MDDACTSIPDADGAAVPVAVNVALPPTASVTSVEIGPVPFDVPHAEPADAAHVHVTPVNVAGNAPVTVAPATSSGPALVATIAQDSVPPGAMVPALGVLVTPRSARMPGVRTTGASSLNGF